MIYLWILGIIFGIAYIVGMIWTFRLLIAWSKVNFGGRKFKSSWKSWSFIIVATVFWPIFLFFLYK